MCLVREGWPQGEQGGHELLVLGEREAGEQMELAVGEPRLDTLLQQLYHIL